MSESDPDIPEQRVRESRCPACGAEATDESLRYHTLSHLGYLHDDQSFECSECGHTYAHGVPVGEPDIDADDLWCDVCDLGFMTVHRTQKQKPGVKLHLKCGHHHRFDCPECRRAIPADGLRPERDGTLRCPWCTEAVDREDAPFCFYFDYAHRNEDDGKRSLVGYPVLTGNVGQADRPYGYPDDAKPVRDADDEPADCGRDECIVHGVGTAACPNRTSE